MIVLGLLQLCWRSLPNRHGMPELNMREQIATMRHALPFVVRTAIIGLVILVLFPVLMSFRIF